MLLLLAQRRSFSSASLVALGEEEEDRKGGVRRGRFGVVFAFFVAAVEEIRVSKAIR